MIHPLVLRMIRCIVRFDHELGVDNYKKEPVTPKTFRGYLVVLSYWER